MGKGCIVFWGRLDKNKTGIHGNRKPHLTHNEENDVSIFHRFLLIRSFLYSDEFEFRPDWTTDYGVSCPWASKIFRIDLYWENGVPMLTCSFLIESSSKLLLTRTGIKARSSLISAGSDYSLWSYLPLNDENFTLLNTNILAHWTGELIAYQWSVVRPSSSLHFQTWISLRLVGQSWSNFKFSITGVGKRLH